MLYAKNLIYVGHFDEGPSYFTDRDSGTEDWLLIYTLSGCGEYRSTGEWKSLPPGSALCYAPGVEQHYRTAAGAGRWELLWAHFLPPLGRPHYLQWPEVEPGLGVVGAAGGRFQPQVEEALRSMVDWTASLLDESPWLAWNALERALLLLYSTVDSTGRAAPRDARIEVALVYIRRHFRETVLLEEVARASGLSVSRLAHLFRETLGLPVMAYLEELRLAEAVKLLLKSRRSVGEISTHCGYASPFYFSLRFKKRFGSK
jgi:AraC family transcriptional regulator of arabinose operon